MKIRYYKFLLSVILLANSLINFQICVASQESERVFSRRQISHPTRFERTSVSQETAQSFVTNPPRNCFLFSFFRKKPAKIAPTLLKENNNNPLPISPLKDTSFEQNSMNSSYLSIYREPSRTTLQKEGNNNLNNPQLNSTNEFNRLGTHYINGTSQPGMLMYSLKKAQFFIAHPPSYKGEGIIIKFLSKENGKRCLTCESQVIATYIFGGIK